tara:strand:- start:473 stop:1366 length:894 start_codon:yes stop_codon:yes gene_type:complete
MVDILQELKFKENDCFICSSTESHPTDYRKEVFKEEFKILECSDCKSSYINKIPADSQTYNFIYDFGGRDSKINLRSIFTRLRIIKAKYYLRKNCPEIKKGNLTILDYGSGDGYLSYSMSELNKDLNLYATDYIELESEFYKSVKFIEFESFNQDETKFDLIILRHVLEHIEEPAVLIKELVNKLKSDGYIMVEIPNHDIKTNKLLNLFGNNYNQIGLPWHFNHFSKDTLSLMLSKYELKFSKNSIPVFGQSLMMSFNKDKMCFDNTGILALLFYPVQIIFDLITNSYTAIILKISK